MGGQACVLYGAAEFSRDTDFAILSEPENLERLTAAMDELQAEVIAVPPFSADFLTKGHAVHFRCRHLEAEGMRVDVMSRMRGVAPFQELWERRTTVETSEGDVLDLLSLPDLVKAKKTQRDKDWPMIRRLIEAHYFAHKDEPTPERVDFWLGELRTPSLLLEVGEVFARELRQSANSRPVLALLATGETDENVLTASLRAEEEEERRRDREYWTPLKAELETLRRTRPRG